MAMPQLTIFVLKITAYKSKQGWFWALSSCFMILIVLVNSKNGRAQEKGPNYVHMSNLKSWLGIQNNNGSTIWLVLLGLHCFSHNLTNRFHVAMDLFSNRSQMISKCGTNKIVVQEALGKCVTNVLTTFWCLLWSITEQTLDNMQSTCFIQ